MAYMGNIPLTTRTDSEILTEVGQRLRTLRRSRRMSQVEAARRSGISRRTLYAAEHGENATILTMIRLLRTYGRLGALESFLAPVEISPIDVIDRTRGKDDG